MAQCPQIRCWALGAEKYHHLHPYLVRFKIIDYWDKTNHMIMVKMKTLFLKKLNRYCVKSAG